MTLALQDISDKNYSDQGMFIRVTVPPPVLPSNAKKLAIGGSRAANALRISCASMPPTMAQTGENSWAAVVANVLEPRSMEHN